MTNADNASNAAKELTVASFDALRNGEITAIVLDDVAPLNECDKACRALRVLTEKSTYCWSADLTILGVSVGEAHESAEALERYLEGSVRTVKIAREVVFDGITPVDRIVHRMLAVWQPGVRIPFLDGQPFLCQVLRRWKTGGGAHPHLDQSCTPLLKPLGIERRFGINVYVEMPTQGGAVEFWNRRISDDEYLRLKRPDYGLDRVILGPADLIIRPRRGQGILFDASKPHAVETVGGEGERITNASFFGYAGEESALYHFA